MVDLSQFWNAFSDWLAALNPIWIFISGAIFANVRLILGAFNAVSLHAFRILRGFHLREHDPNLLNINRDIVRADSYAIDCLLADRMLIEVIKNHFYAFRLSLAARMSTVEDPVLRFPRRRRYFGLIGPPTSLDSQARAYRRVYGPIRSVIREMMSLTGSDYAMLGYPVEQHRLIVALAFEPDLPQADRHWRVFVVWEEALKALPQECPPVDDPRLLHRYETLRKIREVYLSKDPEDAHRFTCVTHWILAPAAFARQAGASAETAGSTGAA